MSLQIWLPCNGNLNNQGVASTTLVSNSGTFQDGGYTGKYYSGTLLAKLNNSNNAPLTEGFTISFFSKNFAVSGVGILIGGDAFETPNRIANIFANISTSTIRWQTRTYEADTYTFRTGYRGDLMSIPSVETDKGHHYTLSWNPSDPRYLSLYIDGVYYSSPYRGLSISELSVDNLYKCFVYGLYIESSASVSDVRVYNHFLSPREVHEISKGLILHYKLDNRQNAVAQRNLVRVAHQYGYLGAGTKKIDSDGSVYYNLTSNYTGTGSDSWAAWSAYMDGFVPGTRYQMSMKVRYISHSNESIEFRASRCSNDYYSNRVATRLLDAAVVPHDGKWHNVVQYVTVPASFNNGTSNITCNPRIEIWTSSRQSKGTIYAFSIDIKDVMITPVIGGDTVIPWTDNSDLTNIVSDCSGYGNDGTANNIVFSSDAVKYNGSSTFNGTNSYITVNNKAGKVTDEITVSCWAYSANWNHDNRLLSCTEGGGWNFEAHSSNSYKYDWVVYSSGAYRKASIGVVPSAGWHHFVGVWDGKTAKVYLDGVYKNASVSLADRTPITYANNYIQIGAESGGNTTTPASGSYFNGRISDVRIYGRAFTDSEVKDLYETRASITDGGSMLSGEFDEVASGTDYLSDYTDLTKISSTGWSGSPSIVNGALRLNALNGWRSHAWLNDSWVGKNVILEFDYLISDSAKLSSLGVFIFNADTNAYNDGSTKKKTLTVSTAWQHCVLSLSSTQKAIGFNVRITDGTGNTGSIDIKNLRIYSPGQNVKVKSNFTSTANTIIESNVKKSSFGQDEILMSEFVEI